MEQIAILGVVIFAFIALFHSFNTIRSLKKMSRRRDGHRPRRPISSPASARSMAEGLIREVGEKHEGLFDKAREQGAIGPELLEALEEPRQYFRERVDARCRPIFNQVIDERILGLDPEPEPERQEP
jgi:hypothetical protein